MIIKLETFAIESDCWENKLGLWFYDTPMHRYSTCLHGVKPYKLNLRLAAYHSWSEIEEMINEQGVTFDYKIIADPVTEYFSVIAEIDAKDYFNKDLHTLNTNKIKHLVVSKHKDVYEQAKKRLKKKLSKTIPEPIPWTEGYPGKGTFLEFTEETACHWAGPFTLGNKQGAVLKLDGKAKDAKKIDYTIDLTKIDWNNLPLHLRKDLDTFNMQSWSKKRVVSFLKSLSVEDKHYIMKSKFSFYTKEWFEEKLPYRIYIQGNDDCSYSKSFATVEARKEELDYLLKMQPLDFNKDILERDYYFTN